jgi:DNA-binding transcriptional LysR family regulator
MSLPLLKLASLDLVRGFVAVGRRMSITQAAADLCLTQSAVSRQIASLEEHLGVRLFRSADAAVQQLQDVMGELSAGGEASPVVLSASIGVAGLWLLPRLARFQAAHPGIDLRLSASDRVVDLRHDDVDLAIRYAPRPPAPELARRLFGETVVVVAHPTLGPDPLKTRRDLARHTLLDFDAPRGQRRPSWLKWSSWLEQRGWQDAPPRGVLRFNQYDQIIHAALAGQGLALGRLPLLQPLLDEGRLVVVDPARIETDYAYWLLQAEASPRAAVCRVAEWIADEAGAAQA